MGKPSKIKAVVVLSGGQDSATALAMCVKKHGSESVAAITFEYGQRHSLETKFARKIAKKFAVATSKVLRFDIFSQISKSALLDKSSHIKKTKNSVCPTSVVEGRNAFFLLAASVWAKTLGASEIWTGISESDFSGYPDCRNSFLKAQQKATRLALDYNVKFVAPFMHKSKADEWALAEKLGILSFIKNETLTCYNGIPGDGCGKCPACKLRRNGYEEFLSRKKM